VACIESKVRRKEIIHIKKGKHPDHMQRRPKRSKEQTKRTTKECQD
jgi:hypothetical protein